MRKTNGKAAAAPTAAVLALAAAVLAALGIAACTNDEGINKMFTVSASAPVFLSYKVVNGKQVDFSFSTPVEVLDAKLEPDAAVIGWTSGETVSLIFEDEHSTGEQMVTDMLVSDAKGNTLNLLLPFRTMNDRIPQILINEIRTQNSSSGNKKGEFIELKTFTDGNVGALRLFISRAGTLEPVYEFPPAEVAAGEYITLHIRTYPEDKAVDELGNSDSFGLTVSTANANPNARDLWTHTNAELLRQTDAVYLLDQNDTVLDAVMFCNMGAEWEKNKVLNRTAEMLAKQGAWLAKNGALAKSPGVNDAAGNNGSTPTRTLCRDETLPDSNTANDWYICKDSGATPGGPNNPVRYAGKP